MLLLEATGDQVSVPGTPEWVLDVLDLLAEYALHRRAKLERFLARILADFNGWQRRVPAEWWSMLQWSYHDLE